MFQAGALIFFVLLIISFIVYIFRKIREDDKLNEEIFNHTRDYYESKY